jgi:hypothetical protein
LERSEHDDTLVVRWVTREHGITLAGPPPQALIDLVPADDLRQEMHANIIAWTRQFLSDRQQGTNRWWDNRWGQPFLVLLYCRALYTIHSGRVGSKLAGARWAQNTLDPRFAGLIQRAWDDRPNPSWKVRQPADPGDLEQSFEFIQYALIWAQGRP